jgi:inosose dehydratase
MDGLTAVRFRFFQDPRCHRSTDGPFSVRPAPRPWRGRRSAPPASRSWRFPPTRIRGVTFAARDGRPFDPRSDETLDAIAAAGLTGYEPALTDVTELDGLGPRLQARGLRMPSLYASSTLHDEALTAGQHRERPSHRARGRDDGHPTSSPTRRRSAGAGRRTRPTPRFDWQAGALDMLGRRVRALGLTLAYHNHDSELRLGGREFHHMLTATDPAHVKFCLDVHWVFRGCGDSQVAIFDVLEHYGERIVELHLRQSKDGVWTETFGAGGDIDYLRLAVWLRHHRIRPLLTLEQAVEEKSPRTTDAITAHRAGVRDVRALFTLRD